MDFNKPIPDTFNPETLKNLIDERESFRLFKANGWTVEERCEIDDDSRMLANKLYDGEVLEMHKVYKGMTKDGVYKRVALYMDFADGKTHIYAKMRDGNGLMRNFNTFKNRAYDDMPPELQRVYAERELYLFLLSDVGEGDWDIGV